MAVFTAATVSFGGLVRHLGKTLASGVNEKSTGTMVLLDSNDLLTRTISVNNGGPTGSWEDDWWSVWNYLQYGAGACIVGGTGSVANTSIGITYGPLHQSEQPFNVVFASGTNPSTGLTSSARAAVNIATTRKDCFAIVGAIRDIGPSEIVSTYNAYSTDFGIPDTDWNKTAGTTAANIIFVPNRKNFIKNWNNSIATTSSLATVGLAADVAGCFGRTTNAYNSWTVPAGIIKGRILNTVSLNSNYTSTETNIMVNIKMSPVVILPGRGAFFFGNTTAGVTVGSYSSTSKISFQAVLNVLRRELSAIGTDLLFRPNNVNTRASFTTSSNTLLQSIQETGSISSYEVVCDATNNTDGATNLVAKVVIYPVNAIEAVTLTVTNGTVSEDYTF